MGININHVEASSRRFHKTAVLLAEKCSFSPEHAMQHHPIVITKGETVLAITSTLKHCNPDTDFYTPYIVNASLSLELLLKWLLYIEKNEWIRGHSLISLFEKLSQESKGLVNLKFAELVNKNKSYKNIEKFIKKELSINIKLNVASILSKSSLAFENWRYAFEDGNKSCFLCYGEIYESLIYVKNKLCEQAQ